MNHFLVMPAPTMELGLFEPKRSFDALCKATSPILVVCRYPFVVILIRLIKIG